MRSSVCPALLLAAAAVLADGPSACPSTTPKPNEPHTCPLAAVSDPEFASICHPGAQGHTGGAEMPAYRCPRVNYTDGVFRCACCGQPLFYATTKFQPAGDGWPAFHGNASIPASNYNGSAACSPGGTEVVCSKCGSHLGDYFPSGTIEPFEYYCIDGVCLLPPGAAEGEVCEPSVAVPPPSKVEAYKALRGLMREKGARATVAIMSAHGD